MSALSTSGLSVKLLLRVIDVKYGYFTLLYFTLLYFTLLYFTLLYFTLLYFTLLYFTLLYFTLLYFTSLYFTLLYVKHLRDVEKNYKDASKPATRHLRYFRPFPSSSVGTTESRKNLEQEFIFQIGTLNPHLSKRQLLESLYGGQFTLSTPLIKPHFPVPLPHRRSTTVPLDITPFMIFERRRGIRK